MYFSIKSPKHSEEEVKKNIEKIISLANKENKKIEWFSQHSSLPKKSYDTIKVSLYYILNKDNKPTYISYLHIDNKNFGKDVLNLYNPSYEYTYLHPDIGFYRSLYNYNKYFDNVHDMWNEIKELSWVDIVELEEKMIKNCTLSKELPCLLYNSDIFHLSGLIPKSPDEGYYGNIISATVHPSNISKVKKQLDRIKNTFSVFSSYYDYPKIFITGNHSKYKYICIEYDNTSDDAKFARSMKRIWMMKDEKGDGGVLFKFDYMKK